MAPPAHDHRMSERVGPEEAKRRIDDEGWVYLDVRSVPEFDQGHPAGAYNIPLMHMGAGGMQPNPDFVAQVQAAFPDPSTRLVLGCRSGGRSAKAAGLLEQAGYTAILDQRAGYGGAKDPFGRTVEKGWAEAGLPTSTQPEPGRSYAELRG